MIKRTLYTLTGISVLIILLTFACTVREPRPFVSTVEHPQWNRNAALYEVNIRHYTPEGSFRAFQVHLPRLKALGVDILWLMPICPIGEKGRKGPLWSYYFLKDYTSVNPEFGSPENLNALNDTAHATGFHVPFDWVANHTALDHPWTTQNPEWYKHDSRGLFVSPYDWTDVIQHDYRGHALGNGTAGGAFRFLGNDRPWKSLLLISYGPDKLS